MRWISVDHQMPKEGEFVIGMRADGWWGRVIWTRHYGWRSPECEQAIVKWCRVPPTEDKPKSTSEGKPGSMVDRIAKRLAEKPQILDDLRARLGSEPEDWE